MGLQTLVYHMTSIMTQKITVVFAVLILTISFSNAQEIELLARGNLSIGWGNYEELNYQVLGSSDEITLLYSAGGGMGLEVGPSFLLANGFAIQTTVGFQINMAFQKQTYASGSGSSSNASSALFSRTFISTGVTKQISLSGSKVVKGIQLGSGIAYNMPGGLTRVENDENLGTSKYKSNVALYFETGLKLQVSPMVCLTPNLRYRSLRFDVKSFSEGETSELPASLQDLNANGLELGLTVSKRIE